MTKKRKDNVTMDSNPIEFMKNAVAVDIDGVLAYDDGIDAKFDINAFGKAIPGAVNFLKMLHTTYFVIIYSTRGSMKCQGGDIPPQRLQNLIRIWLEKNGFVYDHIWSEYGKPIAFAYVDDRAVMCRPQDYAAYEAVEFSFVLREVDCLESHADNHRFHDDRMKLMRERLMDHDPNMVPGYDRDEKVKSLHEAARKDEKNG